MDHCSTLIRNVEIPSTLPSMDTLTKLNGSILLKEVTAEEDGIRIEGDLLWRGYFEEGGGECLWEGAEYFTETIPGHTLRRADPSLIEPKILALKGESLSESTFRLTFDIRWFEDEEKEEKAEKEEEKAETVAESRSDEKPKETPKPSEPPRSREAACPCRTGESQKEPPQKAEEKKTDDLTEKLEAIGETWRETIKTINEADEPRKAAEEEEKAEEVEIKCCPYSKFCLRYYRTREGDELEEIAERFSATVAKLKEFNHLDSTDLPAGRMLRIP